MLDSFLISYLKKKGYVRARGEDAASLARRMLIMESQDIDLVIDIGANKGQYGLKLRELGYKKRIVSFEPMSLPYQELTKNASQHSPWDVYNFGLGEIEAKEKINVSLNSVSSSILDMEADHLNNAPKSKYVSSEEILVKKLDDCFDLFFSGEQNIFLKIDVQGFEDRVLKGGANTLKRCKIVQMEVSLRPLYRGQKIYVDILKDMQSLGFDLVGIEPGFQEKNTGLLLQFDGIFKRKN